MARELMKRGFERVRPLEGGLDAWVDAGLGIEESEEEVLITVRRRDRT